LRRLLVVIVWLNFSWCF